MSNTWTPEQVLALAPDPASAKAGQGLASPRKWVTLGVGEGVVWGECQGSGSKPYQTQIDLTEPAFRCSCPSRKFPCKHGIGLLLLFAGQTDTFSQETPPPWVADWLASRTERKEKQAAKKEAVNDKASPGKTADPELQSKRIAQREARVRTGLDEADLWLRDLVRRGFADVQGQPYAYWENPAARMVDAQAPGIARMLREMSSIPGTGEGWQERLLERLGRLHLLIEGYRRLDAQDPETQSDLRSLVGWSRNQEELLQEHGLRDRWVVLGQRVETEDRLRVQRIWLWGLESGRPGLVLNFAHGTAPLDASLVTGTALDADLVFFPGATPLRALVKTRLSEPSVIETMPGYSTLLQANAACASNLTQNPWLERVPFPLKQVIPVTALERRFLIDIEERRLPISPKFEHFWQLLSLSGGHPMDLFAEWDGETLLPLTVWLPDRVFPFVTGA